MIRALIVDDEPLARDGIRARLDPVRDVTVVGEAGDGPSAIRAIGELQPELLFLDVQMPGMSGFDVLRALDADRLPAVIFVTAYDRYAMDAFAVHALDYLLKPFPNARFDEALERARRELDRADLLARHERVRKLLESLEGPTAAEAPVGPAASEHVTRLTVRDGEEYVVLSAAEIDLVESAGNYVRIHARGTVFQVRKSLRAIEGQLDPRTFVRIHRSTIVNAGRVASIRPEWHGDFDVKLTSGTTVRMSRTFRRNLIP